jgi:hypothetical protein
MSCPRPADGGASIRRTQCQPAPRLAQTPNGPGFSGRAPNARTSDRHSAEARPHGGIADVSQPDGPLAFGGWTSRQRVGPYQPRTAPMAEDDPVVQWLLQGDPAIRWQVLRDLVNASETEMATERARVEHEGWGARLLALRARDGLWANGACFPGTAGFAAATAWALAAGEPPPPFPSPDAEPAEDRPTGRVPSRASRGPRRTGSCSSCATWAYPRTVR